MKVYQVYLCQVVELKDGSTMLDQGQIRTFANKMDAERAKEDCMKELKKKEGYDSTKEWFGVDEWIVH